MWTIVQVKLHDVQLICQEDVKSPFKHIPWKYGYMHFSYETVRYSTLTADPGIQDLCSSFHLNAGTRR